MAEPEQLTAVFENNEVEGPVELYWNDQVVQTHASVSLDVSNYSHGVTADG